MSMDRFMADRSFTDLRRGYRINGSAANNHSPCCDNLRRAW